MESAVRIVFRPHPLGYSHIRKRKQKDRNDKSSRLFLCNLKQWRCRCVKSYSGQRWLCCLPQALSKFRLLKALAEVVALGLGLAREPAPVALVARVLGAVVLLVRLELVVRLGLVVPVPVLAVQALLLRVVLAPAAPAAIR